MKKTIRDLPIFCEEIKRNGERCKKNALKNGTLCDSHCLQNICEGITRKGIKCLGRKMKNSNYCCESHDPTSTQVSDSLEFREGDLRSNMLTKVMHMRKETDVFTGQVIKTWEKPIEKYHLDHVFELNLVRDAFDNLKIDAKESDSKDLKKFKSNIKTTVNQDFNLALTEEEVNLKKSAAIQAFATDYKKNKVANEGIRFYFRNSFQMFTRVKASRICEEIDNSVLEIINVIDKQEECSDWSTKFIKEVEDMVTSMKIK